MRRNCDMLKTPQSRSFPETLSLHGLNASARNPRIYALLYLIGQEGCISAFGEESDDSFPYMDWTLPADFNDPTACSSFLKHQRLVFSEAHTDDQLQRRPHVQLRRGEADKYLCNSMLLGHGSYGVVDRVRGQFSGIMYARKRVRKDQSQFQRERMESLEKEVHGFKRLRHHRLIRYVGSYGDDTWVAFMMLPVAEHDLQTWLRTQPAQNSIRKSFGCLASAVAYLHEQAIRHKDIKPQNILVHEDKIYLTDFGSSHDWKDLDGSTTTGIAREFTRKYAPPEVLQGQVSQTASLPHTGADFYWKSRNSSSDIFSLGCVSLELATVLCGSSINSLHQHLQKHVPKDGAGGLFSSDSSALRNWADAIRAKSPWEADSKIICTSLSMLDYDRHERPDAVQLIGAVESIGESYMCRLCHIDRITQDFKKLSIPVRTPEQKGQAIHKAVREMDILSLKSLLCISDNLDYVDASGETALDCSVSNSHTDITETLLNHCRAVGWIPKTQSAIFKAVRTEDTALLEKLLACGVSSNPPEVPCSPLYETTCRGNLGMAQILLRYGANVNAGDAAKRDTSLHAAARQRGPELLNCLLDHTKDVDVADLFGNTPLHKAVTRGEKTLVALLLKAGANPNTISGLIRDSSLLSAVRYGHAHLIELLIDSGADTGRKNSDGDPADCLAASLGDLASLKAILDFPWGKRHRDYHGMTPLHRAVAAGHESIVKYLLLKTPEDLYVKDTIPKQHQTPLHYAASIGNETILRMLLLQRDPPTREEDAEHRTPLLSAINQSNAESVIRLLVDQDRKTAEGAGTTATKPLHLACALNRRDLAQLLLECGADVNEQNKDKKSPLHCAAQHPESKELLKLLLQRGALVDAPTATERTALGVAAQYGNRSNVRFLIEQGKSDIEAGKPNFTQLMLCAYNGWAKAVEILLENGAIIDFRDAQQRTSLYYAIKQGHTEVAKVLIRWNCEADAKSKEDVNPLMLATSKNNPEVVEALLARGVDLEVRNRNGKTALSKAADRGFTEIVKAIIGKGANVDVKDKVGWSPLLRATYRGHMETARVLVEAGGNVDEAVAIAEACSLTEKMKLLENLLELRRDYKRQQSG